MSEANVDIAVEAVTEAAQDALGDLGDELDDVGDVGSEASDGLDDASESMFELDGAALAAGGAVAGIGGAMQGAINSSQDWRESLGRTATTMGTTQDEAEDMAASLSDATFPMDDAVDTMDSLAQQGIDTEDEMEDVALAMDGVADATGDTAANIADSMGPALSAFGEDLEDADEHMDTFTWVARNTTQDVGEFSGAIERLAPELQDLGMDIDETATVMAALEDEGITGRQAISEFREATNEADGDQEAFMDQLGLSEAALDEQADSLANAEGITEEHADAANESVSTMDQLTAAFDDVKLMAGGLLGPIDALAPALMALGSVSMMMSTINFGMVIPSLTGIAAALTPLLPILLPLIAAVGVLGAAWATDFMGMQETTEQVMDVVGERLEWAMEQFELFRERIMVALEPVITVLREEFMETVEVWAGFIMDTLEVLGQVWDEHFGWVMELVDFFAEYVEMVITVFADSVLSIFAAFFAVLRGDWEDALEIIRDVVERNLARIREFVSDWGPTLLSAFTDILTNVLDAFRDLATDLIGNSVVPDMLSDILSAVTDWDIAGAFSDVLDEALSVVTDLASEFLDAGKNLAGSVADGIRDGISDIGSAASDAASAARDKLPFSPAKEGPLSDLDDVGRAFNETIASGITGDIGVVDDATNELAEHASPDELANGSGGTGTGQAGRSTEGRSGGSHVTIDITGAGDALEDLIKEHATVTVQSNDSEKERFIRRQNINTGGT